MSLVPLFIFVCLAGFAQGTIRFPCFNTGVDSLGTPVTVSGYDLHYEYVTNGTSSPAYVCTTIVSSWHSDVAHALWIGKKN